MLNTFPVTIAVGMLLGFLAGLGVGGGSLLILWLTICLGTDYNTAKGINLLFFIPCAMCSLFFRIKHVSVPIKRLIPAMLCGCISAAGFSWLGWYMDLDLMKKLFGGVLILAGARELFYRPRKAR